MAVVTTSAGVANSALTNLFRKWGDLLGSLDPKFKGKFERVLKAMGTCMQFLSEAVAYFRLRNQREEQRLNACDQWKRAGKSPRRTQDQEGAHAEYD